MLRPTEANAGAPCQSRSRGVSTKAVGREGGGERRKKKGEGGEEAETLSFTETEQRRFKDKFRCKEIQKEREFWGDLERGKVK